MIDGKTILFVEVSILIVYQHNPLGDMVTNISMAVLDLFNTVRLSWQQPLHEHKRAAVMWVLNRKMSSHCSQNPAHEVEVAPIPNPCGNTLDDLFDDSDFDPDEFEVIIPSLDLLGLEFRLANTNIERA